MKVCRHCKVEFNVSVAQFANHSRWCAANPKFEQYKKDNSDRGLALGEKRFGVYKEFTVECVCCKKQVVIKERENLHPQKEQYFCSRNCANSTGGKAKAVKYHGDDVASYGTVAWRHHIKKCIVCGEDKVVAVHHYDENHDNNDPKNLIPLCPTHHQYMHSRFKIEIVGIVEQYISSRWGRISVGR